MPGLVLRAALLCVVACSEPPLAEIDEIYFEWDDRRVLCGANLDDFAGIALDSVDGGLARAAERDEVMVLYAHEPGRTVKVERIEAVLAAAAARDLDFFTFRDLAEGGPRRAGLALTFDDAHVDAWFDLRELFAEYGARVTFFVTRFDRLSDERRARLHQLAGDGHSIEAHGLRHRIAPDYVEENGLRAYMDEEARPSIDLLRADGFDPVAFAYPTGARTGEIDRALLRHVQLLRAVTFALESPLITDPCPE